MSTVYVLINPEGRLYIGHTDNLVNRPERHNSGDSRWTSSRRPWKLVLREEYPVGDDAGLPLHLGIHAGDVTREKDPDGRDNVYGGAVNIASRISRLSAQGEVLVLDTVRGLARTSAGVRSRIGASRR
jgi:class 3 adenylate cyclase